MWKSNWLPTLCWKACIICRRRSEVSLGQVDSNDICQHAMHSSLSLSSLSSLLYHQCHHSVFQSLTTHSLTHSENHTPAHSHHFLFYHLFIHYTCPTQHHTIIHLAYTTLHCNWPIPTLHHTAARLHYIAAAVPLHCIAAASQYTTLHYTTLH